MKYLTPMALAICLVAPLAQAATPPAPPPLITTQKLPWQTATALATAAVQLCADRHYSVTAAVVDTTGHEQALVKGDTVPLQSLSVSYRKAYTAYSYGQAFNKNSISELVAANLTGPENGALNTVPEVLFIPGGVTIRSASGTVLGGLGVSGAPGGDKDEACAADALAQFKGRF
jgi:uncharacterized protein GlcG (DUF336 family)